MLTTILTYGIITTGVAALARALPWPQAALARKPLACVACMAGWCSMAVLAVAGALGYWQPSTWPLTLLHWLGATGVAAVLLAQTGMFASGLTFGD
jgi:hypothetical protein